MNGAPKSCGGTQGDAEGRVSKSFIDIIVYFRYTTRLIWTSPPCLEIHECLEPNLFHESPHVLKTAENTSCYTIKDLFC